MSEVINTPKKFKKYILSHPDLSDQEKEGVLEAANDVLIEYFNLGWMGDLVYIECEVDIPKRLAELTIPYLKAFKFSHVTVKRKWFKRNACIISCHV